MTTSPESGRGAHVGSGGLRSTGHTGPAVTLTVMETLAAACAATAQLSALAEQTATQTQRRRSEDLMRPILDGECNENVIGDRLPDPPSLPRCSGGLGPALPPLRNLRAL